MKFNTLGNKLLLQSICQYSSTSSSSTSLLPVLISETSLIHKSLLDDNVSELWTPENKLKYNKTYENKICHVTSLNYFSGEKSILQLKIPKCN